MNIIRNNKKIILIIIFLIVLLFYLYNKHEEQFAGALLQLYAKGPQDRYLTGDDRYFYYPYNPIYPLSGYYGYGYARSPFLWNEPTRFRRNSAPYLLLTPERYYLY